MEHRFVVDRLFFPTDQDPPKAVHPRGDTFDHPASSPTTTGPFGNLFLTTRLDVWSVKATAGFSPKNGGIIPFVTAQMLRMTRRGTGARDRQMAQCRMKEFLVMHIGAGHDDAQGHTPTIGQHRTFDAQLAPIRGISPGFFPRPRVPWWWIRRDFAMPTECPGVHRIVVTNTSKACGTRGVASTPGSSRARYCQGRTLAARLSIGSRFARYRKCHWRSFVDQPVAVPQEAICDTWVRIAPCVPRGHLGYANLDTSVRGAYVNPP
jgi:hypothetical protein